jgi:hypothetical protein
LAIFNPDFNLPFIAAEEDTGPIVKTLLQESAGKNVIGYRGWSTVRELTQAFTQASGIEAECIMLSKGQSHFPVPPVLGLELDDNWAYCNEFGYEGWDDPTILHPKDVSSSAVFFFYLFFFFFKLLMCSLVGLVAAAGQCGKLLQEAVLVQGPQTKKNSFPRASAPGRLPI